jgi:hypothetical protein
MYQEHNPPCGRALARRLSGYLAVLAALLLTLVAPSAYAANACNVVYTISPQNSSQFGATLNIENTGTVAWTNWSLTWTFANGQTIASSWNGTVSQSGANVTVSEQSGETWENVPAGGSYSGFGFNGTWNIYSAHWTLDTTNWYGYGIDESGPGAPSFYNSYQRGPMESVWLTIPQPCWDNFKYGFD